MSYLLRRGRRRLIEDLNDLELEEDLQEQYQSFIYCLKELRRHRSYSQDDEYRNYHHQQTEYCLVTLTYQCPNTRRRHIDEIEIIQHNRTVFKGCLGCGDQLTFKSKRYRNKSQLKLKFYINGLLEDEMIACCEHGLIHKNRHNHLFHIEDIFGSKPCCECELDNNTSTSSNLTSFSFSRQNSYTKIKAPSSNVLSNGQSNERKSKMESPRIFIRSTTSNNKASSEGFSSDITTPSNSHTQIRNQSNDKQQSEEDLSDFLPSSPELPLKPIYGPPQLATMLSMSESLDSPSPNIHEQTNKNLFKSSLNIEQNSRHSNLNVISNENILDLSSKSTQCSLSSNIESNSDEQEILLNWNTSNNTTIVNDATQILLTRLGLIQQQQIESPKVLFDSAPREKGNVEYFTLIYLHSSYPDESIIKQFRSLINFLKIFNDIDDCVAFINGVFNEKIIFILSNSFVNLILPRIEGLQQIFTIYILSDNNNEINYSSFKQLKVQGLYKNFNDIYEQISKDIHKIKRDLVMYINMSSNSTTLPTTYIYCQLLSEIILDKNENRNNLQELINFSRQEYDGNDEELKIIDEFEKNYQKNQAIYWFSRQCFLSKMLNKALRTPEPDILYKLRLFIQDLFQQIENESVKDSITVYLGQTMQRDDLDNLQKNILNDDLIVFPQFLFGSTDQLRAIRIAKEIPTLTEDYIPILIRIDIPAYFKCANISSRRYSIDNNNDVLLNMGIMGRLIKVEKENINENQIPYIHLTLVKYEDQQKIQQILETKRTEIKSFSQLITLIKLMIVMNQHILAEQIVETMFNDETLKVDVNIQTSIAASCLALATSHRNQDDYKRAVELYHLSLDAFLRFISPNTLELTTLYGNIAGMYLRLDNFEKSYEYYQKALNIQLHTNTPDLLSISNYTNNIGILFLRQEKYSEAIQSFQRTFKILEQVTESHDAELALTYDNTGDAYLAQLKYNEAIDNYKKSIEIQERIVPRNSSTLGSSYYTLGNVYLKIGRSNESLYYLKLALECQKEYLPLTHSSFALLYNNIGLMYYREEQYSEALQCYFKSLEIASISLPENHSIVGITLFNISLVYSSQGKLDEAIESIEKSTEQFLKTLPPYHPDIVENRLYIESIKRKKILKEIFNENIDENTTSF
ncbi:unnamed protein product [Rotaria sordida]|uniref:Uncharacterized protein n=2 Tax=Rotaria sordida TaxID=392033 RepID=A0A819FMH7_9BILA|nr:unnamed protein product [Rotaria sordida]CAF3870618.1 unnamed protein product [Rotaria sordida]